ncbi:MAG TPA: peptidoglycan DD-metalloendopeptidase family protein [Rhizomicrobium sp.]|nr:peptidoglycan DD-metalloendopeptidase family protein [Rhizomicrobium sp.]
MARSRRIAALVLTSALLAFPAIAKHTPPARPHHKPAAVAPTQPPTQNELPLVKDMSGAIPVNQATKLPSTAEQYKTLKSQIAKTRPAVLSAKQKSDALRAQAASLRARLIATAARVQDLEEEKGELDVTIASLAAQEKTLAADFARDRVQVAHLLAVLERLQQDMPPAIAMEPDDALAAARGSMLLGASLPRVYGAAAALSRKLDDLRRTRAQLIVRRAESTRNAIQLSSARVELDQLLAMKSREADEAAAQYGDLAAKLDAAADQATNLGSLLAKVAALRAAPAGAGITVVTAQNASQNPGTRRGSMIRPVVGQIVNGGGEEGDRAPGLSFMTAPSAQVVAPADSRVLFAGRYHKEGQVLILEMGASYDLVLAGLDRIDVRPGDQLLAGEPVGEMPRTSGRLYFEVRENGKGASPAPWLEIDLRKAKRT